MDTELVGLDIGGSHTRGVLLHGDETVREARSGSANVQNVSTDEAVRSLRRVLTDLAAPPGTPVLAGAGGVDTPHDAAALVGLIRSAGHLDASVPVRAVHDTRLVLAAGGLTTGIALIAGTGSVAWGLDASGREARAGGWGHLLGDEGSGWWIGREAVRRVLRSAQSGTAGAGAPSDASGRLERAVLDHAGAQSPAGLVAAFHERPERTHWAALTRVVCELAEEGDATACALVHDAADHLSTLVLTVADVLGEPLPAVVGGGLSTTVVGRETARLLGERGMTVDVLEREPVLGAAFLARSLRGWRESA